MTVKLTIPPPIVEYAVLSVHVAVCEAEHGPVGEMTTEARDALRAAWDVLSWRVEARLM